MEYLKVSSMDELKAVYEKESKISEANIEKYLISNLDLLGENLILIGHQYRTPIGIIDILCKDREENYIVIELKGHKCSDKIVGQIQRYLVWVEKNLAGENNVSGIIFIKTLDPKIETSIKGSRFPIKIKTHNNVFPFLTLEKKNKVHEIRKVQEIVNSLMISIPDIYVKVLKIKKGDNLKLSLEKNNKIIIEKLI